MRRIAFIHGRPQGHPIHAEYAKSVAADFYYEDRILRWQDKPEMLKIRRYTSWIINALLFPRRKEYDIFMTECIRIPQLFMKKFGLISKKQKLVAIMGDESLYFLSINKYPYFTRIIMKAFLNSCDLLICTSKFQATLAKSIVTNRAVQIKATFNGLPNADYKQIPKPKLDGNKMLFLGNIEAPWRAWYKGVDLLIKAFEGYAIKNQNAELYIVGSVTNTVKDKLLNEVRDSTVLERIIFEDSKSNLPDILHNYDLVIHPARGEAWGVTVHMALACGVPTIVSNLTGTKEIIEKISSDLLVDLSYKSISDKLEWYFNLPINDKRLLSKKSRETALSYTQPLALKAFMEALSLV